MTPLLTLLGLAGLLLGVVGWVRPMGWLGISTRPAAGWLVAASFTVLLIAGALGSSQPNAGVEAVSTTVAPSRNEPTTTSARPSTTSSAMTTSASATSSSPGGPGPPAGGPSAEVATVVAITDGDTIEVSLADGRREPVRLIGINSPEDGECWAAEATRTLDSLIPVGTEIGLTIDDSDRDQFDRLLRHVWVGSMSVNEEMVRRGAALSRRYPPDIAMADRLDAAQSDAQSAGLGLWSADACGPSADADLRIVELRYDAEGNDNHNLNDEWIKVSNEGAATVDMGGWGIKDESAINRFAFPAELALGPGETVTVYTGCGQDLGNTLYWCSTGSAVWNNDGDTAFLTDPAGNTHYSWAYTG